jgi:uncharacterized protein (TIGR02453 family)
MQTLTFLKALACNNNREWFATNKAQYETAYAETVHLAEQIVLGISVFDDDIAEVKPKECLFRIYRDARFSKDKPPYKTNFGIYIKCGGKRSPFAGYYLHIEPDNCFVCGGVYSPQPAELLALRTLVQNRFADLQQIINGKNFCRYFNGISKENDTLSNVPRGFNKDSPAAEYLKMKHYLAVRHFGDEVYESKDFADNALKMFRAMYPLVQFLNEAIRH